MAYFKWDLISILQIVNEFILIYLFILELLLKTNKSSLYATGMGRSRKFHGKVIKKSKF